MSGQFQAPATLLPQIKLWLILDKRNWISHW